MKHKYLPHLLIGGILILVIVILSSQLSVKDIQSFVKGAGVWAPVVFILLHTLSYIFAPISGTPFYLAGYPLFGDQFIFYLYLSSVLGMAVNFWIARFWGRKIVARFVGHGNIGKIDEFTKLYGIKALIFLRLFQGNFADFISYAYGLTQIRFSVYFVISALAPIPWGLLWWFVLLPRIDNYREFVIGLALFTVPLVVTSALIAVYYHRKIAK